MSIGIYDADYPWAIDFLGGLYAPYQGTSGPDDWNLVQMATLYNQAVRASEVNNITGVVQVTNAMNLLANQGVLYLWTFYPDILFVYTSNIHGVQYNEATISVWFAAAY